MTVNQISEAIASVKSVLEAIRCTEEWKEICEDDAACEQETNMNDAIHCLDEILCNL